MGRMRLLSRIIKAAQLKVLVPNSDNKVFRSEDVNRDSQSLSQSSKLEGTILQASELIDNAKKEASSIIADAQKQAADIIEEAELIRTSTEEESKTIKKASKAKGIELGYQEGQKQAYQEVQTKTNDLISTLDSIITETNQKRIQILEQSEEDFLKLSLYIAEMIIKREIENDHLWLQPIIKASLKQLSSVDSVTIRISEHDYDIISSSEISVNEIVKGKINWESDASLNAGDCIIDTEYGAIDAGIDYRLEKIRTALKEKMYSG